jgi:hypothetical protein
MSEDDEIVRSVQAHGWHCIAVEESTEEAQFAYTIGFASTFEHPELVVVGLSRDIAHRLLSDVADDLRKGIRCSPEKTRDDLLEGFSVAFREVHRTQIAVRMGYTMAFYRKSRSMAWTALQLFWPDKQGRFPFEPGCDMKVCLLQSRLDIPSPSVI